MFCQKCGAKNQDSGTFCIKCGNHLNANNSTLSESKIEKRGNYEQLDIISEEIEKLGTFCKLGFYIQGFFILLYFTLYTLFIGPIIIYFSGKRGWPKNSLVKAVLYFNAYMVVILTIFGIIVIILTFIDLSGINSNQYDVSEAVISKDELADKVIIINGSLIGGTDKWDSINRTLSFKMTDGKETIDVIYVGDKPDIPPDYEKIQVIVTGKFNNDVFEAFRLLTKCPSKYSGNISESK